MKRINQILKSLNFPKFYEKHTEEDGSIYYIFDNFAVREYSYNDCKLFLDNLPTTEENIHKDDVNFIIQYLEYHRGIVLPHNDGGSLIPKGEVKNYLQKLIDNKTSNISPKIDSILKHFSREFPVKRTKKNPDKEVAELLKPVAGMLGKLAEGLCETLNETLNVTEETEKETKNKPNRVKLSYGKKSSDYDLMKIIETLPYKEEDIHKKDIKDIEKFLLYCAKVSKKSKRVKVYLIDYLLKIVDNTSLGEKTPNLEKMVGDPKLVKIVRKKLDKDDGSAFSDFEQDDKIRKLEKENKKLRKAMKLVDKKMNKNHWKKPGVF